MSVGTTFSFNYGTYTLNYTILTITPARNVILTGAPVYGTNWDLTIPSTVVYSGQTYNVTEVGYKCLSDIANLINCVIPNSVKKIGTSIFQSCSNLTNVTLPNVTGIDLSEAGGMFNFCSNMTGITIPPSWTIIPLSFAYQAGFRNVNFSSTTVLTQIVERSFMYCTRLTSITIPDSVKILGKLPSGGGDEGVFHGCSSLASVIFGVSSGLTLITSSCFTGCSVLTSTIKIPDVQQFLPPGCFNGCSLMKSFTIPSGITSISYAVFSGSGLTTVVIPNQVTTIGAAAFSSCINLTGVQLPTDLIYSNDFTAEDIFVNCTALTGITVPANWKFIPRNFVDGCSSLKFTNIPSGVTSIGAFAYRNCSVLTSVLTIPLGVPDLPNGVFENCFLLTSVTIPNSVTNIGDVCFQKAGITSIAIPDSVRIIGPSGGYSFASCTSLKSISFGVNSLLTQVGNICFWGCSTLTSMNIPTSLKYLPYGFLSLSRLLPSIIIPSGVTSLGLGWIHSSGITTIVIPDTVTSIGENAFGDCQNLTGVQLPSSITYVANPSYSLDFTANGAFASCISLRSITIPNTWNWIPQGFLNGCLVLKSANIPSGTTSIGIAAYANCGVLTSILTIPSGVSLLPQYCFNNCNSITSITIPNSVTSIDLGCFNNTGLKNIIIPSSVTNIAQSNFNNTSTFKYALFTGNIPATIGTDTFTNPYDTAYYFTGAANTANLSKFTTSVALTQSFSVNSINYNFTNNLDDSGNIFVSITGNTLVNNTTLSITIPAKVTNLGVVYKVQNISSTAFQNKTSLTTLIIPGTVTSIDANAFSGCTLLSNVTFQGAIIPSISSGNFVITGDRAYYYNGATNTSILSSFFTNQTIINEPIPFIDPPIFVIDTTFTFDFVIYKILSNDPYTVAITGSSGSPSNWVLTIPSTVTYSFVPFTVTKIVNIGYSNTNLVSVTIPDSVTSFGWGTFYGASNLTSVQLPANLIYSADYTGQSAFEASGLRSITIPANWTFIPINFLHVTLLTKVIFNSNTNLKYIDSGGFSRLATNSIRLPSSLTSIAHAAVNDCKYVLFMGNIPSSITTSENFINTSDTAYYFTGATNREILPSFFSTTVALTQNFTVDNINYSIIDIDDSGNLYVSITGNTITINSLSIPSSVTDSSIVYTVISISSNAFQNKTSLTSVTIPATISSIDTGAFSGCTSLTIVTFDGSVIPSISSGNFGITGDTVYYFSGASNATILSSFFTNVVVRLRNFSTTVGNVTYNFISSSGLNISISSVASPATVTSVSIPSTVTNSGTVFKVTDIINFVFSSSSNLTNITVNSYLPNFRNGFFGINNTELQINFNYTGSIPTAACIGMNKMTSITIPSTITSIEPSAFQDCAGLKNMVIPSSINSIGSNTFKGCSGLTSLTVNSYIPNLAYGLNGLDNKNLQINFIYTGPIPDGSCYRKSNVTSITIPQTISALGRSIFDGCYALNTVTFTATSGIKIFPNRLFNKCSGLTSITIPSSVTRIDNNTFTLCSSLKSIVIPSSVTSIGQYTFSNCSGLTSIVIPSLVTSIGQYAFSNCSGLTSVTFSSTTALLRIENFAFQNCVNLPTIIIPKSATNVNANVFAGCTKLTSITISA